MRLSAAQRRKMFERIYLMEDSPDILAVRDKLELALRHAVRPQHRAAFVERLEGWWFGIVVEHLMSSGQSPTIPVGAVHQRVHDLREQFHATPCRTIFWRLLFRPRLFVTMTSEHSLGNFASFK